MTEHKEHEETVTEETASEQQAEDVKEAEGAEQSAEEVVQDVEAARKIEELTKQLEEQESKRLRALADLENTKRRAALDYQALQTYRSQNVIVNILPVLDNFERALSVEAKEAESQSILTGMEMVYRSLIDALASEGLEEIEALDKEFDPNFHQAVMTGNDSEKPSGIVLEELQKGYKLKDRVLRPSMVKVNE